MNRSNLAIPAAGLVTCVGYTFEATGQALRAGISGTTEGRFVDPKNDEPFFFGRVKLPQWWEGTGKLVDLVAPAILECAEAVPQIPLREIPVLLGVTALDRPSRFKGIDREILTAIEKKLDIPHHKWSRILPDGHVAGVTALRHASELLTSGAPCCIIAGVDSLIKRQVIKYYYEQQRLLSQDNSNGFVAGEAGTAVLVMPRSDSPPQRLVIRGIGFGQEEGTAESETPLSGDGMTEAFRAAFKESGLGHFDIGYRIADLNGEHYKFLEAHIAEGRFARKFDENGVNRHRFRDLWHPIEYIGEIGAAISPGLLAVALHAGRHGYAPGPIVLIHVSNDDGRRAAVVAEYEG